MTLLECSQYYNFHDSAIVDVQYNADQHMALLRIELPWWNQTAYQEGDPQVIEKTFQFVEVSVFECPDDIPYDQVGIFSVKADAHSMAIYVVNDITYEDFTIRIGASSVIERTLIPSRQ